MLSMKNLFVLLALCITIRNSWADTCEQCMDNSAYCINATHFYFCNGDTPLTNLAPNECDSGTFCTNSPDICSALNGTVERACADDCNVCSGQLACVSQTQFALCRSGQPTTFISSCDAGYVCSVQLFEDPDIKKICAPTEVVEYFNYTISCSNSQATTTTIAPSTIAPATATSMEQQCEQARLTGKSSRFFYTKNTEDSTCNSYIYCQITSGSWETVFLKCKNSGYFDSSSNKCVQTKPEDC